MKAVIAVLMLLSLNQIGPVHVQTRRQLTMAASDLKFAFEELNRQ